MGPPELVNSAASASFKLTLSFSTRFGAIDAKLASKHSFPSLNFAAVTGPTHDQHPPFSWNQPLPIDAVKPNFMPIEIFDFPPFDQVWTLNNRNSSKSHLVPQYSKINDTLWQNRIKIRQIIDSEPSRILPRILFGISLIFTFVI